MTQQLVAKLPVLDEEIVANLAADWISHLHGNSQFLVRVLENGDDDRARRFVFGDGHSGILIGVQCTESAIAADEHSVRLIALSRSRSGRATDERERKDHSGNQP